MTCPRHDRESVVAAKNTSAGEYAGCHSRYLRDDLGPIQMPHEWRVGLELRLQGIPGQRKQRRIATADERSRFTFRVAQHHWNICRQRRGVRVERIARQRAAVLDGTEIGGRAARLHDLLHRQRAQAVDRSRSGQREGVDQRRGVPGRSGHATGRHLLAAVRNDAMKQAAGLRHRHQRRALRAAARVAEDRHVARDRRQTPQCCRAPIPAQESGRAVRHCRNRRARRRRTPPGTDSRTRSVDG